MRPVELLANAGGSERTLLFCKHGYVNEEHTVTPTDKRVYQRQVGWLGFTGNVYALHEEARARSDEPGGYRPLYIDIE